MTKVFVPDFLYWLLSVDRTGRPGIEVGRSSRSTDVHRRARQSWLEGRSTEPVDR